LKQYSEFCNGKSQDQNYNKGSAFGNMEHLPKFEINKLIMTTN
jgi:hypothetical protein